MFLTCGVTGHRPGRFSFGYNEDAQACRRLRAKLKTHLQEMAEGNVREFSTGMAQGVDMWAAQAVLELRESIPDLRLTCVLPCAGQARRWPPQARQRHMEILRRSDRTVLLQEEYTPRCMLERDRWLVDNAHLMLAVYDGGEGGTAYTVRYAVSRGKRVLLLHPDTLALSYV